jgi:hypothetical protein
MVKNNAIIKQQRTKVGAQHLIIFLVLLVVFFLYNMFNLIPWGTAQFVVPLFKPTGEQLQKVGFVKFDGLVWASTTKDKEALIQGKNVSVSKDYINRDYIFDFTFQKRTMEKDGYVKGSDEFYVRSEILGENAIILQPYIGFTILALDIAMLISVLITIVLPTRLGLLSLLFDRQIDDTKTKIRLQTGFSDQIVDLLTLPDDKLSEKDFDEVKSAFRVVWNRTMIEDIEESYKQVKFEEFFHDDINIVGFRNFTLYSRIKEFFSDFLVKEILDTKNALLWRRNHFQVFKGVRLYMSHHITEKYQNFVTGMAYGGAAFLIVAVGIRGLKFIPAAKPSFILLAIFLEFTMLSLLAITLMYTEEEERMDKMLKKMEDANRSQLEALRGQQTDIHQLANALVGQTAEIIKSRVEKSIEQYMSSGDKVQQVIAQEIARKIIFGLRESDEETDKKSK